MRRKDPLSLDERVSLYRKAGVLRGEGTSFANIDRILDLGAGTSYYWIGDGNKPTRRSFVPDLSPSNDLAYLVGFWLGDGRSSGREKQVRFKLGDKDQVDKVGKIVARVLRCPPNPIFEEEGFYCVRYSNAILYDFLQGPLDRLSSCIGPYKSDFLRGIFDAEGYVSCRVDTERKKLYGIMVGVVNTNEDYLALIESMLTEDGITCTERITNRTGSEMKIRGRTYVRKQNVRHLVIRGESVLLYAQKIGFTVSAKAEKLADLLRIWHLPPSVRYAWFTTSYLRVGRKWVNKRDEPRYGIHFMESYGPAGRTPDALQRLRADDTPVTVA